MSGGVAIVGLGNVLLGDDALGPWVLEWLSAGWQLPEAVTVIDAGTPGLDLSVYLAGFDTVIVVDTVRAKGAPGELRLYAKEDLMRHPPGPRTSPHDPGLFETLTTLELGGVAPREVVLVGVIPESVETGVGLSRSVAAAATRAAEEVVRQLASRGLVAAPRVPAIAPSVWWERGGAACA